MPAIDPKKYEKLKKMYADGATMLGIARKLNVSIDAVTYAMRKGNIPRRTLQQASVLLFSQKAPSFQVKPLRTMQDKTIATIGVALYWAEGYKTERAKGVDFANSDSSMIVAFLKFLRTCYLLDETRLRISLYCYADQDISKLITYWSNLTKVPPSRFQKPYVRQDFREDGRKMQYGLIHIRYNDKKLLYDILERINRLKMTI